MLSRNRAGLTLVEVMLSLALGGMVLVLAHAVISQLTTSASVLGRTAQEDDARANARRWFFSVARQADIRADTARRFIGDSSSAQFWSRCAGSGGWLEPCYVTIVVDAGKDSAGLVAVAGNGAYALARSAGHGVLRYLEADEHSERWLAEWGKSVLPPAALALVVDADTTIIPVAGR